MGIEIRSFQPEWAPDLEALQRRYIAAQPEGTKFVPASFYHTHPALDRGRNVPCAFGAGRGLVGYGALIPTPAADDAGPGTPHTLWTHIRVDPEAGPREPIQDPIFEALLARAQAYSRAWEDRPTRLAAACPEPRQDEIAYFEARGMRRCDALLQMARDLVTPVPPVAPPEGIAIRRWPMATRDERAAYLAVEAQAFPQAPRTVEELEFYLESWRGGTPIAAFDAAGNLVGSVMAHWYNPRLGLTEDVFVAPAWQRRGIARGLLREALAYLREQGLARAGLEVRESNHAAVRLYQSLGYQVFHREVHLELYL